MQHKYGTMARIKTVFLFGFFLFSWNLAYCHKVNFLSRPYEVLAGPEVYYLERRVTEGGRQRGLLGGGRLRIERLRPHSLYLGLEGWSAAGQLRGEDTLELPMDSQLIDAQVEGRAGYTTYIKYCPCLLITPFFGYGKFFSINDFSDGYVLPVTFHNEFEFFSFGFKTRWRFQNHISAGFDFKLKSMFEGLRRITGDPGSQDIKIRMGDDLQYSFDFPIQYDFCRCGWRLFANVTPFFRLRNYGFFAHKDYEVDFYETRFHIFGVRFLAGAEF